MTTIEQAVGELRYLRPKWEGLHSFDKVWDATLACGLEEPIIVSDTIGADKRPPEQRIVSGRVGLCMRTASVLRTGHPINFGSAQLEAIVGLAGDDGVNPYEFIEEHRPAFDRMFIDYSDVVGNPTMLTTDDPAEWKDDQKFAKADATSLYAASYWRSSDDAISIVPFGSQIETGGGLGGIIGISDEYGDSALPAAGPVGALLVFPELPDDGVLAPQMRLRQLGETNDLEVATMLTVRSLPDLVDEYLVPHLSHTSQVEWAESEWDAIRSVPSNIILTVGGQPEAAKALMSLKPGDEHGEVLPFSELSPSVVRAILAQAIVVLRQVTAVIDSLYFLDSHNVTIEDAQVSRQVRRRAQRSNGEIQIAQTVRVGPTKVRRTPRQSKGGTANYSHRFERRGYTRHVTKGSHAKADLIRPCYRRDAEGNLTCPNGCRREWVPPTIVGDEELPFVPKSRVLPGPNTEN